MKTDEELFLAYKGGDEAALTLLFDRYRMILTAYITKKMRDANVADDVVQNAFIKVVRYKDHFEDGKSFPAPALSTVQGYAMPGCERKQPGATGKVYETSRVTLVERCDHLR